MKRLSLAAAAGAHLAVLAVSPHAQARAELDPSVNGLRIAKDSVRSFDFESAESLEGLQRATWLKSGSQPQVERTPIATAADIASQLTNGDRQDFWGCFQGKANGFFAQEASPPGSATRIAWLNTYDVSANDFMPKLLKGRTNVKIFAPHPTSGAFGSISSLPSPWTGWSGGSLQVQDARFAPQPRDRDCDARGERPRGRARRGRGREALRRALRRRHHRSGRHRLAREPVIMKLFLLALGTLSLSVSVLTAACGTNDDASSQTKERTRRRGDAGCFLFEARATRAWPEQTLAASPRLLDLALDLAEEELMASREAAEGCSARARAQRWMVRRSMPSAAAVCTLLPPKRRSA